MRNTAVSTRLSYLSTDSSFDKGVGLRVGGADDPSEGSRGRLSVAPAGFILIDDCEGAGDARFGLSCKGFGENAFKACASEIFWEAGVAAGERVAGVLASELALPLLTPDGVSLVGGADPPNFSRRRLRIYNNNVRCKLFQRI